MAAWSNRHDGRLSLVFKVLVFYILDITKIYKAGQISSQEDLMPPPYEFLTFLDANTESKQ